MLPAAAVAALPLDDDNLLFEILLRLPPLPSSLPRASLVCRRWRCLASDPAFSRRFRIHHRRNPPLLGYFYGDFYQIRFEPTLKAPNRVLPGRLSLQFNPYYRLLGCRHGLVLILDRTLPQVLVWDPVTCHQHRLAIPPEFDPTKTLINGAVLCSAAGDIHFKVVLAGATDDYEVLACVYSSETGVWGNIISTSIPSWNFWRPMVATQPAVLVGYSLYWILAGGSECILEFDLQSESLGFIRMPVDMTNATCYTQMRANDGELGLLSLTGTTTHLWKRKTDCDGAASWGVGRTIELDKLLSLDSGRTHGYRGLLRTRIWCSCVPVTATSQSSSSLCSSRNFPHPEWIASIHLKVSMLQVSRVVFWLLRCRSGLVAEGSSIYHFGNFT